MDTGRFRWQVLGRGVLCGAAVALALAGCTAQQPDRPDAPHVGADEYSRLLEQTAADAMSIFRGKHPDVDPDSASLIRVVDPSEWGAAFSDCLTNKGFSSGIVGGHVETDIFPPDQTLAYDVAVYECQVGYPIDPMQLLPFSPEELSYLYDYYAHDLSACLEENDITVDPAPTLQRFHDTYGKGEGWDPYASVTGISEDRFQELIVECPPWPEGFRGH